MFRLKSSAALAAIPVSLFLLGAAAQVNTPSSSEPPPDQDSADTVQGLVAEMSAATQATSVISLEPGAIQSLPVDQVTRVAIGDPNVADVEVVSSNEIFLQGKAAGSTNLIIWDRKGQRVSRVEVTDRAPEVTEAQLRQLLDQLGLPSVSVRREHRKIFLTGVVPQQGDLDRLEQMLTAFREQVTNLVSVAPPPPAAPPTPPPSVKLMVQVLEMSRDATDKLGVDWSDSVTFAETTFPTAATVGPSLWRRAEDAFRIGAISRSGTAGPLSGVLKFLASKGKARILAEPKLVASSGKEATAFLGVEVPVITATSVSSGTVTQSIEFKNTGVELKFKPTVLEGNQSIQLSIDAKVSSIDMSVAIPVGGVNVPGFKVRKTQTEIVTGSGQSVLISGLLQDEEKKNLSQVPAVGSIPVLGNLFRSTEFIRGQTELIVVVTPELLTGRVETVDHGSVLEQALARTEIAAAVEDPSLRYALQVQDRIAKSIRYPLREEELGLSGRVKLRLRLFRDGTLKQATVSESSGIESFDTEAVNAAENQAPYPPFPSSLAQQELWLEVPVLFRP